MTVHRLPGARTAFATSSRYRPTPADRVRHELTKLGLKDWLRSAPGAWLTSSQPSYLQRAIEDLRARCDGAVSYAARISADEGRIARERFRDVIDALEAM